MEHAKNCQEMSSELIEMRFQRITSVTCTKTGYEKRRAEHGNAEETGHQFELRIFFVINSVRPFPFPFCLKHSNFLLLVQPLWASQNKDSGNRRLKCVLAEAVGLYIDLKQTAVKLKGLTSIQYGCLLCIQSKSMNPKQ